MPRPTKTTSASKLKPPAKPSPKPKPRAKAKPTPPPAKPSPKPKPRAKAKPTPPVNPKPKPKQTRPQVKPTAPKKDYSQFRESQAAISRERSKSGREIGPLPPVTNRSRRDACEFDLRLYLETYLAAWFPLPWSDDHLVVIALLQVTILKGGRYALAMPRGSGKTSLCEGAELWAASYGHRRFIVPIGATAKLAEASLDSLKNEFETNDLLAEDFPEICHPIRELEGIANRCAGQTLDGERTRIGWTKKEIVLPTVAGSKASAVRIRAVGLTGSGLRGPKAKGPNGEIIRPDLAIPDDPQTDKSARSPNQNAYRESLVCGAMLGMAGPGKLIAAVMPCTVIQPGDMADRVLNRKIHPEWNGTRTKLLRSFPARDDLWQEYAGIRKDGMVAGDRGAAATDFYRLNRRAMDDGGDPSWAARFNAEEISALQHAMNLWIDDPRAFQSEYQNEPEPARDLGALEELKADAVAARLTKLPRLTVPIHCSRITASIDVQQKVLYYAIVAWDDHFGGSIIDYGAWPAQNRAYFTAADPRPTLADRYPGLPEEAAIYAGLKELTAQIFGHTCRRQHADVMHAIAGLAGRAGLTVERCLADSGYATDTIYDFCQRSTFAALLTPSKGFGIGASSTTIAEWKPKPGERRGHNWLHGFPESGRGRLLKFDANGWKSFVAGRLRLAEGAKGALYLFGERPQDHQMFADHVTSEYRVRTRGRGRDVEEWKLHPGRENHWWDCLVGCAVAASFQGLILDAGQAAGEQPPVRKALTYREMQLQAEAASASPARSRALTYAEMQAEAEARGRT